MSRVLLIDDDADLVQMLKEYLDLEGFAVSAVHDGEHGLAEALTGKHDIAVLDVMMPGLSGVDVLRRLRGLSQMPVLMLTARGDDMDRILGLELGADDYVPKPCTPRELSARIRAILRRLHPVREEQREADDATPLSAGALEMWPAQRRICWSGRPVELTSTEFNLLEVLLRNQAKAVSKNELSEKALGRPLARFDRNIDVHMSSLRHKLGTLTDGRSCIHTVHRRGYMLLKE